MWVIHTAGSPVTRDRRKGIKTSTWKPVATKSHQVRLQRSMSATKVVRTMSKFFFIRRPIVRWLIAISYGDRWFGAISAVPVASFPQYRARPRLNPVQSTTQAQMPTPGRARVAYDSSSVNGVTTCPYMSLRERNFQQQTRYVDFDLKPDPIVYLASHAKSRDAIGPGSVCSTARLTGGGATVPPSINQPPPPLLLIGYIRPNGLTMHLSGHYAYST